MGLVSGASVHVSSEFQSVACGAWVRQRERGLSACRAHVRLSLRRSEQPRADSENRDLRGRPDLRVCDGAWKVRLSEHGGGLPRALPGGLWVGCEQRGGLVYARERHGLRRLVCRANLVQKVRRRAGYVLAEHVRAKRGVASSGYVHEYKRLSGP